MSPEVANQAVASLASDLAHTLAKAAALAGFAASATAREAGRARTIETFLDLEPLVFDAQAIINAASLLHRRVETGSASRDPP